MKNIKFANSLLAAALLVSATIYPIASLVNVYATEADEATETTEAVETTEATDADTASDNDASVNTASNDTSETTSEASEAAISEGTETSANDTTSAVATVSTYEELDVALCNGGEIVLGANIDVHGWLARGCEWVISKDTTIDFNGYTITSDEDHGYNLDVQGATLTFKDATGKGGYTQLGNDNVALAITNGKFVLEGATVTGTTWVVTMWHDSEMVMNGGKIVATDGFAITGNGITNPNHANYGANTKITLNSGEVIATDDYAVYHPQANSTLTINKGMKITGAAGAVAVNNGTVVINGGTLTSLDTAEVEGDAAKQDGTYGYSNAVIGIAKEYGNVSLTINGGEFIAKGEAGIIVADPSGLNTSYTGTVKIYDGTFTVEKAGAIVRYNSANVDIYGGIYSVAPGAEYIAEGKVLYELERGTKWTVTDEISYDAVDDTTDETDGENEAVLAEQANEVVGAIIENLADLADGTQTVELEDGSTIKFSVSDAAAVRSAVASGEKISVVLTAPAAGEYTSTAEQTAVEALLDADATTVGTYAIDVLLMAGTAELGNISELSDAVVITLDVSSIKAVENGYTRTFQVVRYHDGKAEELTVTYDAEAETISFESDKFSNFTVAYTDTLNAVPDTGAFTASGANGTAGAMGSLASVAVTLAALTGLGFATKIAVKTVKSKRA